MHPWAGFSVGAVSRPCHLTFWCSASSSARKRSVSRRVAPICVRGSCVARSRISSLFLPWTHLLGASGHFYCAAPWAAWACHPHRPPLRRLTQAHTGQTAGAINHRDAARRQLSGRGTYKKYQENLCLFILNRDLKNIFFKADCGFLAERNLFAFILYKMKL